jgi:zinc D-Ala-D-Ala carboxypeptidase
MYGWRSRLVVAALGLLGTACSAGSAPISPLPSSATGRPTPAEVPGPQLDRAPERIVGSASLARPAPPDMVAAYRPDLVADHCADRDLPAPPAVDEALAVLDRSYALPAGYVPADLVAASEAGLTGASATKLVRSVVVDDLADMAAAWKAAGLTIEIESAYRSYASQAATFESWAARIGHDGALSRSARPGHSEHQLGTALDLTSAGWSGRFGDWAVESDEGAWMAANGWKYGFVMSYPASSQEGTCFSYEPWHYRWIGRERAAEHHDSGLDLRRFLERYVDT